MSHWDYIGLAGWSGGIGFSFLLLVITLAGVSVGQFYDGKVELAKFSARIMFYCMVVGVFFWAITAMSIYGGK